MATTRTRPHLVRDLPADVWRAAVDAHPQGNIFHTPEMFEVFERASGYHPELWAALSEHGVDALFTPVRLSLRGGPLAYLTTRAVAFGGTLSRVGPEGLAALEHVLRAYTVQSARSILFTEIRHLSDPGEETATLGARGFTWEDHLDYLVDLDRPAEDILQSIGQRTRKQIRQGVRRGEVTVEFCLDREGVAACYDLISATYSRARILIPDRSLFESVFDVLHPKSMVLFVLARVNGEPAAASVELLHRDTIFGWYGGVDRRFGRYTPNELLMWHVLRWGAENGYRVYDFGGAGKPGEEYGVRDFKAKFGGELVAYGRSVRRHAPVRLAISTAGYEVYRRLATRKG